MSDKTRLPCDVLVQPATLIQRGCRIETLLECIDMRRERSEKGPPLPDIISKRQEATITDLRAELAEAHETIIAFAGPWATQYARGFGLPAGHLHPTHYDILAKAGARMDGFTRAALTQTKDTTDDA